MSTSTGKLWNYEILKWTATKLRVLVSILKLGQASSELQKSTNKIQKLSWKGFDASKKGETIIEC